MAEIGDPIELAPHIIPLTGTVTDNRFGSQNVFGKLSVRTSLTSIVFDDGKTKTLIKVSLQESHLNPGRMILTQQGEAGFYIDDIDVRMWLGNGPIERPDHRFELSQEAPDSGQSNQSGGITSSISFGVSAGVGTFAADPTTSASVSASFDESFHHEFTDFTFSSESDSRVIKHFYFMQQTRDGHPYKGPASLIDTSNPLVGARLHPLPILATSNLPIMTQAVWQNVGAGASDLSSIKLNIQIEGDFCIISATNNFFKVDAKHNLLLLTWDIPIHLDLSLLKRAAAAGG